MPSSIRTLSAARDGAGERVAAECAAVLARLQHAEDFVV